MHWKTSQKKTLMVLVCLFLSVAIAFGRTSIMSSFHARYNTAGTALDIAGCDLCHGTQYYTDLKNANVDFAAVENMDSDRDGFTNIEEIRALTLPGDPRSFPQPADTAAPSIFINSPTSASTYTTSSGTISLGGTASDNVGVTGVSWSSSGGGSGSASGTSSWAVSGIALASGTNVITVTAHDVSGNSASDTITVAYNPPDPNSGEPPADQPDTTKPQILSFSIPAESQSLTVPINALSASDNIAVTGYRVSESSANPDSTTPGWSATAPGSHTFSAEGTRTLYAWVKDAAGNVSNPAQTTTSIAVPATDPEESSIVEGIQIWEYRVFRLRFSRGITGEAGRTAYLQILDWDTLQDTFNAILYTREGRSRSWQTYDVPLHATSGDSLNFFFWFELKGEYQFSASITGIYENDSLASGVFTAAGVDGFGNENDSDDRRFRRDSPSGRDYREENPSAITIKGVLVEDIDILNDIDSYDDNDD